MNCLELSLLYWDNHRDFKILYNNNHAICIEKEYTIEGYLDLSLYGEKYLLKSFKGLLSLKAKRILKQYLK